MRTIGKITTSALAGACALAMAATASLAASNYEGTWQVKDTEGTPFEIVLGADGTAVANRGEEDMAGTWTDEDGVAVIRWTEGWTTKIAKTGDGYTKTAWKSGKSMSDEPTNSSDATKK